jgi:hypothetical protein
MPSRRCRLRCFPARQASWPPAHDTWTFVHAPLFLIDGPVGPLNACQAASEPEASVWLQGNKLKGEWNDEDATDGRDPS